MCDAYGAVKYYSGNNEPKHRRGIGIVISKNVYRSVINFLSHSDRIALLKVHAKPVNVNFIQVPICTNS